MNDTKKITIVSLSALLLGFVGLYIYIEIFEFTQFTTELDNNSNDFLLTEKRISIFGGSSSIVLNTTHIEENISNKGFNQFHIYNFGWVADTPTKRLLNLDELIIPLGINSGFKCQGVMINSQIFTKTSNIWGITNNAKGTNTNRIVLFSK